MADAQTHKWKGKNQFTFALHQQISHFMAKYSANQVSSQNSKVALYFPLITCASPVTLWLFPVFRVVCVELEMLYAVATVQIRVLKKLVFERIATFHHMHTHPTLSHRKSQAKLPRVWTWCSGSVVFDLIKATGEDDAFAYPPSMCTLWCMVVDVLHIVTSPMSVQLMAAWL